MGNFAAELKAEISRLAKKEIKREMASLKKASAQYRSDIAALKRRNAELERTLARLGKQAGKVAKAPAAELAEGDNLRWRPAGFAKLREKLGLSAADLGKLIGVSALSVYKWEKGQVKPRAAQLAAIAAVRHIGKREALRRLEGSPEAAEA
jgi:DNA-binding transcriptional regulator YiaG